MVDKQQLISGIIKYAETEIVGNITDKASKIALSAIITTMAIRPDYIEQYLNMDIVRAILNEKNGEYDLDGIEKGLTEAMQKYGGLTVRIPAIKFISPEEKLLTFTSTDVRKLREYIEG